MPAVFICHASEDKPAVEPIQLALVGLGCQVFYDEQSLPPGGDYHARIAAAIAKCTVFVFIASKASLASGKYTLSELGQARNRWPSPANRVVPVAINGATVGQLPAYLRAVTILETKGNAAAEVRTAVDALLRYHSRRLFLMRGGLGLAAIVATLAITKVIATHLPDIGRPPFSVPHTGNSAPNSPSPPNSTVAVFAPIPAPQAESTAAAASRPPQTPASASPPVNGTRVALVIGNASYKVSPLRTPVGDARAVTAALQRIGFDVLTAENADRTSMLEKIREFRDRLNPMSIAVVYFSGHGVQVNGENYLVPVDASPAQNGEEIEDSSVSLTKLLRQLSDRRGRDSVVILDASRDHQFLASSRTAARGLARVFPEPGTLVAFSASPNEIVQERNDFYGTFAERFVHQLSSPNRPAQEILLRVRADVAEGTRGSQKPWVVSDLILPYPLAERQETTKQSKNK